MTKRVYSHLLNSTGRNGHKIELLAPAGNLEKAKTAIRYGADAVYVGGTRFSLRSRASNFSLEDLQELTQFAKAYGAKVHVTVNMLPHPDDFDGLKEYLLDLDKAGIDAIIAASPAILSLAGDLNVSYELHVSTQHSTTNSQAIKYWKSRGVDRVVLARECTLEQIESIAKKQILPVEVFIHGGMCISYSGRCVLSNHMTMRDANRGGCAQSCRWKYHIYHPDQPDNDLCRGERMFSMSSRDLQAVDYIEDLIKCGVSSLKIEGRMKSSYYIATVISAYRRLIDEIYENGSASEEFREMIRQEIFKAENRPTGPGFFEGLPDHHVQLYRDHDETVTQEYVAEVLGRIDEQRVRLRVRNKFSPHSSAEVFGPDTPPIPIEIGRIFNEAGEELEACNHPMDVVIAEYEGPAPEFGMIRKKTAENW